jgi:hypothetical protein
LQGSLIEAEKAYAKLAVHFWPSFICMNVIFLPMFLQGMLSTELTLGAPYGSFTLYNNAAIPAIFVTGVSACHFDAHPPLHR